MAEGLTNSEVLELLELPSDTLTRLQTEQGSSYQAVANQFLEALYNKILYQQVASMEFTNPFKKYDGFPVKFGDTIENVFVELPKGYEFDSTATNPFSKAKPSVKTLYATINYELQYKTTIEDSLLRRACLSEYGFMNLIDTILGALAKGMSLDEYTATIAMLNNADIYADGIEEITKGATDEETAEIITKKIVDMTSDFALPSDENNKMGVMQVSKKEDVLLVIKYDLLNKINLDFLSGVFNLSKVDLVKNIITVKSFQTEDEEGTTVGEDIDFVILDSKGFDNHIALQDGGMIYNPQGKYTNHFYNLWKIISFKYFYNARAYKLVDAE